MGGGRPISPLSPALTDITPRTPHDFNTLAQLPLGPFSAAEIPAGLQDPVTHCRPDTNSKPPPPTHTHIQPRGVQTQPKLDAQAQSRQGGSWQDTVSGPVFWLLVELAK